MGTYTTLQIEFTTSDSALLERVVTVLEPFHIDLDAATVPDSSTLVAAALVAAGAHESVVAALDATIGDHQDATYLVQEAGYQELDVMHLRTATGERLTRRADDGGNLHPTVDQVKHALEEHPGDVDAALAAAWGTAIHNEVLEHLWG